MATCSRQEQQSTEGTHKPPETVEHKTKPNQAQSDISEAILALENSYQKPMLVDNEESPPTENKRKKRWKRIWKNKEITIATINTKGMRGKIKSLESLLQKEKITIALITETMLKKVEQISIKGYRWIDRPRANNSGGEIGITVSEEIAQNTTEDANGKEHEQLETKWIKIECRPKSIAIGAFYGPQEHAKSWKCQGIYTTLSNQITQKAASSEVIIAGDFNAKLTINKIDCNQQESRNGKLLKEMIDNNNLVAASLNSDSGNWTRINRKKTEEKSVIHYIITTPGIAKSIQTLMIDEEGHIRVKGKHEMDHNTILMSLRINDPRAPTYRDSWKTDNSEGWKQFNKTIQEKNNMKTENYNHRNLWRSTENNYKNLKKTH